MTCVLCQNTTFHEALKPIKNPRPIGAEVYTYQECAKCKLWNLDPLPTQDELTKIYTEEYNLYENTSENFTTKVMNMLSVNRLQTVKKYVTLNKKLLDVGCGNGSFLQDARNLNLGVYGTEWSEYAALLAKQKVGDNHVYQGNIENIPWQEKFNCITAWHVLEHNLDPKKFIMDCNDKLENGGYVILEVPNATSEVLKRTQNNYPWFSIPEHVTYWQEESLKYLAKETGFNVIESITPFSMPFLYSKVTGNTISRKIESICLQWSASHRGKSDIIRQVWKKSQ